ncbi:MAG: biotin transporter BioY [Nitriliruptoraceae bacterium]
MSASPRASAAVLADRIPGALARDAALVTGFALAIALSAQLAFPLPGTPILVTAQTLVVLLGAATLGATRASIGAGAFLLVGLAGVPAWFAHSGGTSTGYIIGFVAAALVVGRCARSGLLRSHLGAVSVMVGGNLVIYAFGVPVLAFVLGIGLTEAVLLGVVPFLIGDAVKIAIATVLLPQVQRLVDRTE